MMGPDIKAAGMLRRKTTRRRIGTTALGGAVALVVALTGCSSTASGSAASNSDAAGSHSKTIDKHLAGTTITILMPPWANMGNAKYAEFTKRTGINVKLDIEQFDQVHDKVVTAMASGVAPADVIEVDSLWMGQFGTPGWLTPLEAYLPESILSSVGAKSIFQFQGKQIAMPYALDFRWIAANMTLLQKAGINEPPTSWSSMLAAAKALKAKGVAEYPIGMPLSVTAETAEPWLNLTEMDGGGILDAQGKPAFNDPSSPGYKALTFLRTCYEAGLINPAYVSVQGEKVQLDIAAGRVVFDMRNGPSIIYTDPKTSSIAKDKIVHIVMGETGPSKTVYGLPEGMGIPSNSSRKDAAAMFIAWYNETPQQAFMYTHQIPGVLPAQPAALAALISNGTLSDGQAIKQILPGVKALFPAGAPTWWPAFANDAAATVQAVVLGHQSVTAGLNDLAAKTTALSTK